MRLKPLAAGLTLACLAVACSGDSKPEATPSPTPSATPSPTPTVAPVDLLTGTSQIGKASLVAIKVDNAPLARAFHRGLGEAAIVYEELVEGGLTRFLAVYQSDIAGTTEVGPIRSARESDVDILRAFRNIPVGFSGAQGGVLNIFRAAENKKWVRDASYDEIPSAYRLGEHRKDARNFYSTPAKLAALRPGGGPVDIGFRFGPAPTGVATTAATAAFSPHTSVGLRYDPASRRYAVSHNGRTNTGVAPATVIIQSVTIKGSGFRDVNGFTTPRTVSHGSGKVVILENGVRIAGTWKRKAYGATRYLNAKGKDIALAPGPIWVLLLPSTGQVTYS